MNTKAIQDDREFMKEVGERLRRDPVILNAAREHLERATNDKDFDDLLGAVGIHVCGGYKSFEANCLVHTETMKPVRSFDELMKNIYRYVGTHTTTEVLSLKKRLKKNLVIKNKLEKNLISQGSK